MKLKRVIAHQVLKRSKIEIVDRDPTMSLTLAAISDPKAHDVIIARLQSALSKESKCVQMSVEEPETFNRIASMIYSSDEDFIEISQTLALRLSNVQTAGNIKSGTGVFIEGTCSRDDNNSRFIAVVKADPDDALQNGYDGRTITLNYLSGVLFGDSQRLIKIAFLVELDPIRDKQCCPDDFVIKVYDHVMQNSSDKGAAAYFYRTFLGCRIASNAEKQTKEFFEITRDFIYGIEAWDSIQKEEYYNDSLSFFRGNDEIIEPRSFAERIFPVELQDSFVARCRERGIDGAFSKDTSQIRNRIKKRTLKFSSNLKIDITGSPEAIDSGIRIEREDAEWTTLKILGRLLS